MGPPEKNSRSMGALHDYFLSNVKETMCILQLSLTTEEIIKINGVKIMDKLSNVDEIDY
jgi:hypothetical protein